MISYILTVPAENRPGTLSKVTGVLSKEKINIRAVNITSFGEGGYFYMVVDDPQSSIQALEKAGVKCSLREVIAVLIEDHPGSLDNLVKVLFEGGINIENACGFVLDAHKQAVFVVEVDNINKALDILKGAKYKTLDPEALNAIEPFHYMKY